MSNTEPASLAADPEGLRSTEDRGAAVVGADREPLWLYVAPLVLLLLSGSLFPWPVTDAESALEPRDQWRLVGLLAGQGLLVGLALVLWYWFRGRDLPLRVSPWSLVLGLVGVVLWVALAACDAWLVQAVGLQWLVPSRGGFDPFQQISDDGLRNWFFLFRFAILAVLVPFAEEIFLRGWLARWFDPESVWWNLPLQKIGREGLWAVTAYAVLAHPMEALAALVWFNLVSWWMKRTGSLGDCIAIHATTNLLLGIWIVRTGNWQLW